jgi:hypothetical protein
MTLPDKQKPAPGERGGLLSGVLLDGEHAHSRRDDPENARLMLRSVFNDDGHFQGLEVAS